jgi:hypothetical protein
MTDHLDPDTRARLVRERRSLADRLQAAAVEREHGETGYDDPAHDLASAAFLIRETADLMEQPTQDDGDPLAGHVCFPYWTLAAVALFVALVAFGLGLLAA